MKIEVTRIISPLERERFEFSVSFQALKIRVELLGFHRETRQSMRHTKYELEGRWIADTEQHKSISLDQRIAVKPKVPLPVQREVRRQMETAMVYEFDICLPKDDAKGATH